MLKTLRQEPEKANQAISEFSQIKCDKKSCADVSELFGPDIITTALGVRIFFCKLSICGKIYIFQGRAFVLPSYNIS